MDVVPSQEPLVFIHTSLKSSANSLTVDIATVAASFKGYLNKYRKIESGNEIVTNYRTTNFVNLVSVISSLTLGILVHIDGQDLQTAS